MVDCLRNGPVGRVDGGLRECGVLGDGDKTAETSARHGIGKTCCKKIQNLLYANNVHSLDNIFDSLQL